MFKWEYNYTIILYISVPQNMRDSFSDQEIKEYRVTWYRDCKLISTNDTKYSYGKWKSVYIPGRVIYRSFNTLKVNIGLSTSL